MLNMKELEVKNILIENQDKPVICVYKDIEKAFNIPIDSLDFALEMDILDPLKKYREQFCIPLIKDVLETNDRLESIDNHQTMVYFSGNSLGLQPKTSALYLNNEMEKWAKWGSLGHFKSRTEYDFPWAKSEEFLREGCAYLIGALPEDVACMNSLTINIHLMFVSFYRPTQNRYKILMEDKAFPSDYYAIRSQIKLKGHDPDDALICLKPREGEHCLRNEDIIDYILQEGEHLALIFFGSVHYYSGNVLDVQEITKVGKLKGCNVGWDFAHAIGNIQMNVKEWDIDFAVWCSYKYINGGPGSIGGIYVNPKHRNNDFPKLLGWWGHKYETRFIMDNGFDPETSPSIYKISNSPSLYVGMLLASFKIFQEATMEAIIQKSYLLTGYLISLLTNLSMNNQIEIITPIDAREHGNQLSLYLNKKYNAGDVCQTLYKRGIICDVREPNVIRVAPVPLYNSYRDVYRFYTILKTFLNE